VSRDAILKVEFEQPKSTDFSIIFPNVVVLISYMSKKVILIEHFKKKHNFEIAKIEMKMMNILFWFFYH